MSDPGVKNDVVENLANEGDTASLPDTEPLDRQIDSPAPAEQKVEVLLKAAPNTPIMKRKKFLIYPDKKVAWIIDFLKKNLLKLEPSESLFLYVNQTFAPSPDQTVKNLYDCFGTDGKLILHYCKTQAWG